jgi:membrane protease YdiL (CAAX protease family)
VATEDLDLQLNQRRHLQQSQRWFWLGCSFQAGLGALGAGLLWFQQRPLEPLFHAEIRWLLLGLGAVLPLLMFFHRVMTSRSGPFLPIRRFLEDRLRPLMASWSISQLACISLLAGVGEELLFRGAIQGWASARWGEAAGLVLASGLFGAAHSVNKTYAITAAMVGVYLGSLYQISGGLLSPILTHAVYDFLALVWFLRISPSIQASLPTAVAVPSPADKSPEDPASPPTSRPDPTP